MSFFQIIIIVAVSVLCVVSVYVFVLLRLLLIDCSYDVFGDSIFVKCVYDMILFMHKWYLGWYDFFRCFTVWFNFEISLDTFFCNQIENYHAN
jgi:hypothetical protein